MTSRSPRGRATDPGGARFVSRRPRMPSRRAGRLPARVPCLRRRRPRGEGRPARARSAVPGHHRPPRRALRGLDRPRPAAARDAARRADERAVRRAPQRPRGWASVHDVRSRLSPDRGIDDRDGPPPSQTDGLATDRHGVVRLLPRGHLAQQRRRTGAGGRGGGSARCAARPRCGPPGGGRQPRRLAGRWFSDRSLRQPVRPYARMASAAASTISWSSSGSRSRSSPSSRGQPRRTAGCVSLAKARTSGATSSRPKTPP